LQRSDALALPHLFDVQGGDASARLAISVVDRARTSAWSGTVKDRQGPPRTENAYPDGAVCEAAAA
jgi:hypothetical protein